MHIESKKKVIKIVVKMLMLILIPIAFSYFLTSFFPIPAFSFKREIVIQYLVSFKDIAPFVYVILQAATIPLIPVPSVILATAAGIAFGFWQAVFLTTFAWMIGTSINYFLARLLGRPFLKKILNEEEFKLIDKFAESIGWKLIFFTWFIPGGTGDIAGYAAGLTKMSYYKYFLAAFIAASLLSIFTSAAGASIAISPILATIFTLGAAFGIVFGFKLIFIYSLALNLFKNVKCKFFRNH